MVNLGKYVHKKLKACKHSVRSTLLNLFCDFLLRWGNKVGISPNFRGRMLWKAGRRDIVPRLELYRFLLQERPMGQYYPNAPQWSWRSQTIIDMLLSLSAKRIASRKLHAIWAQDCESFVASGDRRLDWHGDSEKHAVKRLCLDHDPSLSHD